jgi:hypothetical protein
MQFLRSLRENSSEKDVVIRGYTTAPQIVICTEIVHEITAPQVVICKEIINEITVLDSKGDPKQKVTISVGRFRSGYRRLKEAVLNGLSRS